MPIQLFSYLGKTRNYHSCSYNLDSYAQMYFELTGQKRELRSLPDLIDLALEEWQQNYRPLGNEVAED